MADSIRVLHVDDDPAFAELAATFLQRIDDEMLVEVTESAEQGLERLEAGAFDCVVSDYNMPQCDGIGFLEVVRADHGDLPFVLFTGRGSEEIASEAISAGVTDYLQKETGTEQYAILANRVRNAVERYRSQQALAESEQRLSLFIEQSPLGVIEYDHTMTIVGVNAAAEEIFGYCEDELVGGSWNPIVPDDVTIDIGRLSRELLENKGGFYSINENVRKDGERIICEWHNRVVTDEDDEVVAIFSQFQDVTEHEETRRQLERNQQRYQLLAEQFPDGGIFVFDRECRYLLAGGSELAAVGLTPEEMEGQTPHDVFPAELAEELEAYYRRALAGETHTFEQSYQGEHYQVHTLPLRSDDGTIAEGMAVSRNVTDRVKRDRQLDALRERSQTLMHTRTPAETARVAVDIADDIIDAPLSGVHLLDESGTTLVPMVTTEAVSELFDAPPTFARDAPAGSRAAIVWEVFTGEESLAIPDLGAYEPLTEPSPAGSAIIHPLGDHGVFTVSSPHPHAFDETTRSLAEILATTLTTALDRVAREQRLRDRETALERLHDATRALVTAGSPEAIAAEVRDAAEEILGFSIVSVRLYDEEREALVPAVTSDSTDETLPEREVFTAESGSLNWRAFEAGEPRRYDDIAAADGAVDADTSLRSLMIFPMARHGTLAIGETVRAAFDENDVFLAGILATAGETALEAAARNAELREQHTTLTQQNERLEEFASVVSHDLRGPLSVLDGSLELARETGDQAHLERARRATERMRSLIDDLLSLSRAGQTVGLFASVDLPTLAEQCWSTIDTAGATLVVDTDVVVEADASRLRQALENLVRNSVEHGGEDVTITVGALDDGFYIADDGPGIPSADRETVLESGYTTAEDGTGFGLAIVEQVATAHGWTLTVTESESGGARFEFTDVTLVD